MLLGSPRKGWIHTPDPSSRLWIVADPGLVRGNLVLNIATDWVKCVVQDLVEDPNCLLVSDEHDIKRRGRGGFGARKIETLDRFCYRKTLV